MFTNSIVHAVMTPRSQLVWTPLQATNAQKSFDRASKPDHFRDLTGWPLASMGGCNTPQVPFYNKPGHVVHSSKQVSLAVRKTHYI